MDKELIISSAGQGEVQIALLENKQLVELHSQKGNAEFAVGDIYLGKVTKLLPALNAAFLDIGHPKEAFLHYTDMGPKLRNVIKFTNGAVTAGQPTSSLDEFILEADINKAGKVVEVLQKKQLVAVQILKEPISTKGPRLSCELTLPGRYMVLTPFANNVSVSKKINSAEERKRLQLLAESIRPKNFGLVMRTASEGKGVQELHEELLSLMEQWEQIHAEMHKATGPKRLLSELNMTASLLRDLLNDSFTRVAVDTKEMYNSVRAYLETIAPDKVDIVKLHNPTATGKTIFEFYAVTRQINQSFGKTASMPSGSYLVIEHTEAMHVIDVNSGNRTSPGSDMENNAYGVNMEAAVEIARQLRLRDIGGLIVVDFIDMRSQDHKNEVLQKMKEAMASDKAKHTILPITKFGLLQITRERVRPEMKVTVTEEPSAPPPVTTVFNQPPTSKTITLPPVAESSFVLDDITRDLTYLIKTQPQTKLSLVVHPFVYAYMQQGFPSLLMKWWWKYKRIIKLSQDVNFQLSEFKFFDENKEEIRLS